MTRNKYYSVKKRNDKIFTEDIVLKLDSRKQRTIEREMESIQEPKREKKIQISDTIYLPNLKGVLNDLLRVRE